MSYSDEEADDIEVVTQDQRTLRVPLDGYDDAEDYIIPSFATCAEDADDPYDEWLNQALRVLGEVYLQYGWQRIYPHQSHVSELRRERRRHEEVWHLN